MHDDSCKVELPRRRKQEKPIPSVYPVLDTDLARDNVENDIPAARPGGPVRTPDFFPTAGR